MKLLPSLDLEHLLLRDQWGYVPVPFAKETMDNIETSKVITRDGLPPRSDRSANFLTSTSRSEIFATEDVRTQNPGP